MGDSGYVIVRESEVLFHSPSRQYKFNHPFQCGTNYKAPWHADKYLHQLQHGDIIILASDGLWDNLSDSQILACLHSHEVDTMPGQVLKYYPANGGVRASAIATQAYRAS